MSYIHNNGKQFAKEVVLEAVSIWLMYDFIVYTFKCFARFALYLFRLLGIFLFCIYEQICDAYIFLFSRDNLTTPPSKSRDKTIEYNDIDNPIHRSEFTWGDLDRIIEQYTCVDLICINRNSPTNTKKKLTQTNNREINNE